MNPSLYWILLVVDPSIFPGGAYDISGYFSVTETENHSCQQWNYSSSSYSFASVFRGHHRR